MVLLNNETFLAELSYMFQKSRLKGSVTVTMKKYDGRSKPRPRDNETSSIPSPAAENHYCLMRAIHKTKKISTVIHQKDVSKFHASYSNILKGNLDSLKKIKKPKGKPKAT